MTTSAHKTSYTYLTHYDYLNEESFNTAYYADPTADSVMLAIKDTAEHAISTDDRDTSIRLNHSGYTVSLGNGRDVINFNASSAQVFTGLGADTFVFNHSDLGTNNADLYWFKGAGQASGKNAPAQDFIIFKGYPAGSHLELFSDNVFQHYVIVDPAGNWLGTVNLWESGSAQLKAGADYAFY